MSSTTTCVFSLQQMVPWGFRKMLNWIKENYDNPTVFVTENGFGDNGGVQDTIRVNFYTVQVF